MQRGIANLVIASPFCVPARAQRPQPIRSVEASDAVAAFVLRPALPAQSPN